MRALRGASLVVSTLLACACGPSNEPVRTTNDVKVRTNDHGDDAFDAAEALYLRRLGAIDRRLAIRTGITPSDEDEHAVAMAIITTGDEGAHVVGGALDPFSFDARDRALANARKDLESAAPPTSVEGKFERALVLRLADEESARLTEERNLPYSASSLVKAMIVSLDPPRSNDELAAQDRWISLRLAVVDGRARELKEPARRELDDALDPIDRIVGEGGYTATAPVLAWLRGELDQSHEKGPRPAWSDVSKVLLAHTGADEKDPAALDASLATTETLLDAYIKDHLPKSGDPKRAQILTDAEKWVAREDVCRLTGHGSRVRSIGAPPERTFACHLVHALKDAGPDDARLALFVALRDDLALARWSIGVGAGPDKVLHPFMSDVPLGREERLARLAQVRPVITISAGIVAKYLVSRGIENVSAVAAALDDFGDAPLDVTKTVLDAASRSTNEVVSSPK